MGYISRTGNLNYQTERLTIQKVNNLKNLIGPDGVLWSMFLIMTMVLLGVWKPVLGITFTVVGMIMAWALQLMTIGWTALVSIIIIGGILMFQMNKKNV